MGFGDDAVRFFGLGKGSTAFVPAVDECRDGFGDLADRVGAALVDGLAGDDPNEISAGFIRDPDVGVKCTRERVTRPARLPVSFMRYLTPQGNRVSMKHPGFPRIVSRAGSRFAFTDQALQSENRLSPSVQYRERAGI